MQQTAVSVSKPAAPALSAAAYAAGIAQYLREGERLAGEIGNRGPLRFDARGKIKARISENGGSEHLPGALPLVCQPGDVTIVNRQMLHGSL